MPREYTALEENVHGWVGFNKILFFAMLSLIFFLLTFLQQTLILNEIPAFQFGQGSDALIFKIFSGLELLSIPLVYAFKFTLVGFVLWVGCFLWGYRVTYEQCWQIAMIAEVVFIVPELIKIFWFLFVQTDPSYWDFTSFYPLSIMNLYDYENVATRYWYPNKAINLFEFAYWIALTYGIDFAARKKKSIANSIVLTSYVPLFLMWLWFYIGVYD